MVVCPTHKKYNLFDFHLGNIHALWGQRALFFRKQAIFDTKKKIAGIAKATLRRSASEMPKCQSVFPFSFFLQSRITNRCSGKPASPASSTKVDFPMRYSKVEWHQSTVGRVVITRDLTKLASPTRAQQRRRGQ